MFPNQTKLLLSRSLAPYVALGDEITFPIPEPDAVGPEILVSPRMLPPDRAVMPTRRRSDTSASPSRTNGTSTSFLRRFTGEASASATVFLPCEVLREYFYGLPRAADRVDHPTLYEVLRIPASASPSELRVAFKLRDLELSTAGAAAQRASGTGAGIQHPLVSPNCALAMTRCWPIPKRRPYFRMVDSALFSLPASLPVMEQTFFARRILAFAPDLRRRRFHVAAAQM